MLGSPSWLSIAILAAGLLVLLLACVLVFPRLFVKRSRLTPNFHSVSVDPLKSEELRLQTEADRLKAENDVRTTLLQGLGGLALLAGVILTWVQFQETLRTTQRQLNNADKQFKETQDRNNKELAQSRAQFEAAQDKTRQELALNRQQYEATLKRTAEELALHREGQVTERFTRAIDQLGRSESLELRLGGIYALERIARDSARDRGSVLEVLSAFVREHAPWKEKGYPWRDYLDPKQEKELKELMARLEAEAEQARDGILKPRTDIQAVMTVLGRLGPHSEAISLHNTDLRGMDLYGAHLEQAWLADAHLEGATLTNAHFENARLPDASLWDAWLYGAHFEGAILSASFRNPSGIPTFTVGGKLRGVHLEGADLGGATGLRANDFAHAICDSKTKLPLGISPDACSKSKAGE